MNILELAKTLKIDTPEFIDNYSNQIDEINEDNFKDMRDVVEFPYFQDSVSEHADSSTPVYYSDIDKQYENCGVTIDDVINAGLMESMDSESDISNAKQVALYMSIERETYSEIEDFITELEDKSDKMEELFTDEE